MLKQKRTKVSRARGTNSHSWGHKKKHRGSGHRGGFGLAGTGARGDSQKAGLLAKSKKLMQKIAAGKGVTVKSVEKSLSKRNYFGKKGFKSIHTVKRDVLSISYLEENFDKLVEAGIIVKEGNEMLFDSTNFKYNKILGNGSFSKKITVICQEISANAKAKIESAGGKVIIVGTEVQEESSKEE